MAKETQRGWKKYVPSLATIGKVFISLVAIKAVSQYLVAPNQASLPNIVRNNWPTV